MDFGAMLLGLLTAFVIKIAVIYLAGTYLLRLYGVGWKDARKPWLVLPKEDRAQFRLLTVGLCFFFLSELTCGVEIYILTRSSLIFGCLHSVFSSLAMAFTGWGLYRVLDRKYLHLSDRTKACFALKICKVCQKRKGGKCHFRHLFLLLATMSFWGATPLFFLSTAKMPGNPRLYALPFSSWNRWYDHSLIPWLHQYFPQVVTDGTAFYLPRGMLILEFRILPVIAMILALLCIFVLLLGKEDLGIVLLFFSFGVLSYALFEGFIYGVTREPFYGSFLHEGGELFFLVILSDFLTRLFPPGAGDGLGEK